MPMRHTRGYDLSKVQGDIVLREVFVAEFLSTAGFFETQGFPEAFTRIVLAFLSRQQVSKESLTQ